MADTSLALAFTTIVQRVIPGATLLAHRPLKGGVSAAVHALDVSSSAGLTRLVLRRHGAAKWKALAVDLTRTEFQLLTALYDAAFLVPRPRLLDASGLLLPSPFFVMDRVEGSDEIPQASLDAALRQMAAFLARLHSLDVEALRLPRLPPREDPVRVRSNTSPTRSSSLTCVTSSTRIAFKVPADVAGCRAELSALLDEAAARTFTEHYLAATGDELRDLPLWDVYVGSAALATLHDWGLPPETKRADENERRHSSSVRQRPSCNSAELRVRARSRRPATWNTNHAMAARWRARTIQEITMQLRKLAN